MSSPAGSGAVRFHSQHAGRWSAGYERPGAFRRRAEALLALFGDDLPGRRVLDAGCGSGWLAREMARRGARVVATDASDAMLQAAVAEGREPRPVRLFRSGSVEQLGLRDGACGGVLCSSVLEYVDDLGRALGELARVLESGGLLVASVPLRTSVTRRLERLAWGLTSRLGRPRPRYLAHSRHALSRAELSAALDRSGFQLRAWRVWAPLRLLEASPALATLLLFSARRL